MKAIIRKISRSTLKGAMGGIFIAVSTSTILGGAVLAQEAVEETTTTETTSAGTISDFGPDSIVIRTEKSPEPLPFAYSSTTTYVDETGTPVSREIIKPGVPVTVYYVKEGDRMVASKVVVRRTETSPPATVIEKKKTTTTTTTDK